eukprot:2293673-Pleurochrysis_carterae.AAC.1
MSIASGDAGLESAVGAPEPPTAKIKKAVAPSQHPCPGLSLHLHAPCTCRPTAARAWEAMRG